MSITEKNRKEECWGKIKMPIIYILAWIGFLFLVIWIMELLGIEFSGEMADYWEAGTTP